VKVKNSLKLNNKHNLIHNTAFAANVFLRYFCFNVLLSHGKCQIRACNYLRARDRDGLDVRCGIGGALGRGLRCAEDDAFLGVR